MASISTNRFTSFTITQPFLGAPLQFQPALGSKELEELVDFYVVGAGTKQDKLSEVTIDFYNNATVDLNTGALTKTYTVFPSQWTSFEQSPTQSQSSGFSPSIFTPSPGSSATFGDSGYGSISLTPPNRSRNAPAGRVAKKVKKETKVETRLPGFSIMTKDGIDVTSSAGRGTKTKEQREHAHLMRIMKACESCKRKKVRCDPSHRRSHDMSRTSTSTTSSATKSSDFSRAEPSPRNSIPSLTPQTSQGSSFSPSNAIDDFVLFPEDSSSWNAGDLSFDQDLSQFNFDINNDLDLTDFPPVNLDQSFDMSYFSPSFNSQYAAPMSSTQYNDHSLEQWAEPQNFFPVNHTRPHPTSSSQDATQLDVNWSSDWADRFGGSPGANLLTDNWSNASPAQSQISPTQHPATSDSPLLSSASDWSILETTINANMSDGIAGHIQSSSSGLSSTRRKRNRSTSEEIDAQFSSEGVLGYTQLTSPQTSGNSGITVDSSDPSGIPLAASSPRSLRLRLRQPDDRLQSLSPRLISEQISTLAETCQFVSDSLRKLQPMSNAHIALGDELEHLRSILDKLDSSQRSNVSGTTLRQLQTLASQLQAISSGIAQLRSEGETHQNLDQLQSGHLRQCQVQARRAVRSLCATINNEEAENSGTSSATANARVLTSGRNVHLFASPDANSSDRQLSSLDSGRDWTESTMQWQQHPVLVHGNSAPEAIVQQALNNAHASSSTSTSLSPVSLPRHEGSSSDASVVTNQVSASGSIPQAMESPPAGTNVQILSNVFTKYYSLMMAVAILGSLFIASPVASALIMLTLPTVAMMPSANLSSPLLSLLGIMGACVVSQGFEYLQQSLIQWIGTDPLVSFLKLALCATLVAQAPTLLARVFASANTFTCTTLAVAHFLFGESTSKTHTSSMNTCAQSNSRSEQWLRMIEEWSPVGIVV